MLEKDLEQKLRKKIKQLGGRAYKFVSPGNAGVMDRIVLLPEKRIYFVEMKRPGEKLRKLQERQKSRIERMGFKVIVISSEEELEKFIEKIKE